MKQFWLLCLLLLCWLVGSPALAGPLADRMAAFPNWQSKPPTQAAVDDLAYPTWMAGTWNVTTQLVDLVAPLAPEVTTPGFESNRAYLNQPISFRVRFGQPQPRGRQTLVPGKVQQNLGLVVADRAFNGLNLARAYLGDRAVLAVKVDPADPNRQITLLRGDRQLVSLVTERAVETPGDDRFLTTEVFQQVFRGTAQPYLNQVETTTDYHHLKTASSEIEADQITAIYLSPQDPDYFKAKGTPVALYRYRLVFKAEGGR